MTRVLIIIVNYRSADLAVECLRSLAPELAGLPGAEVIVVDNASGDDSLARLAQAIHAHGWRDRVSLRALPRNGGFAFGNNAAIRDELRAASSADYIMLLNPDTVIRPGAVRALLDFMKAHPRAGIAGSGLEDAQGEIGCSAHNAPSPLGELEGTASLGVLTRLLERHTVSPTPREYPHQCAWVSGASQMVRRRLFEEIGLFDEGFFLYFEEVDFSTRARAAGWQVWHVPRSRVMHAEGASTGIRRPGRRPPYWYASRRRYFVKHFGVPGLLLADALWAAGRASLVLRRRLGLGRGGSDGSPQWFALDLLWGDLKSCLSGNLWRIRRSPASS